MKTENGYKKIPIGKAENLTGQKFKHWTVLFRTENDKTNKPVWVCQCDCDNHTIKPVSARTLKNGTSTSCGCQRLQQIKNNADLKIHKIDQNGNIILKKCSRCGKWLSLDNFWKNCKQRDGYCGECKHCQNTAKESRYNTYKKNAKKRNIDFSLTKEQFYILTSQPCAYCGEFENYNGIDRIDSNLGYDMENCVPCCETCNKMKNNTPIQQWLNKMNQILKYYLGDK